MPNTINEIPRRLPRALKVVYNPAKANKSIVKYLDHIFQENEEELTEEKAYFPAVFEPVTNIK